MDEEKVLDKVRKLLAMANDERGNEHEREQALRMAHNMLTKYNLDMLDVEKHIHDKEDPRARFDSEGWSMKWTLFVRKAVAELFMCKYFYGRKINGTRCEHSFVGRESNAVTAEYISSYVIESILKEGRRLYKHNLSSETRAFALGCTHRIQERIAIMIKEKVQELVGTGKDLAILDLAKAEALANDEFIKASGTSLVVKKSKTRDVNVRAYGAGREYGGKIGLNVQVARPKDQLLLK